MIKIYTGDDRVKIQEKIREYFGGEYEALHQYISDMLLLKVLRVLPSNLQISQQQSFPVRNVINICKV